MMKPAAFTDMSLTNRTRTVELDETYAGSLVGDPDSAKSFGAVSDGPSNAVT